MSHATASFDDRIAWRALRARDPRFDGLLYVGVTSTGIYCRPICPARTPRAGNCRFFSSAAAAEKARFRPCLRCRPELAPGLAPVDDGRRIAALLSERIERGGLAGDGIDLETIAKQFHLSSRQLRRIVQRELGVSPIELLQTRRLLLAKQLLTETKLPVTEIAFASGFGSLRRFNDAFRNRYQLAPTRLRRTGAASEASASLTGASRLLLSYRAPYEWPAMLAFLGARALAGVEEVDGDIYRRSVRLGSCTGWIAVRHVAGRSALSVEFASTLTPVLPVLLGRLRHLFDLSARPDLIAAQLRRDPLLRADVARRPGLRVPGAFDGFELALRAILGQQITVAAATGIAAKLVQAVGAPIATPFPGITRLAPVPAAILTAGAETLGRLGIIRSRARAIVALAEAISSGDLVLEAGAPPEVTVGALQALPGIGPWTAHYIAMRALRWPDAFPSGDAALLSRLGLASAAAADRRSERWRPWRSYAVLHLWGRPAARAVTSGNAPRKA